MTDARKYWQHIIIYFFFFSDLQPSAGYDLLFHGVS
jgi:hypothetical protein